MSEIVRITAVGDIAFQGRNCNSPDKNVFRHMIDNWSKSDLVIGNLEGPLTNNTVGNPQKESLRGVPEWANVLKMCGFNFVSLANNHMLDYGNEGLLETIKVLNSAGILYAGAGENEVSACSPAFLTIKNTKFAIIARSSIEVNSHCFAKQNEPGVAFFNVEETLNSIKACREQVDFVICILHWGLEQYSYPSPSQRDIARDLSLAGADLIIGHHPHVVQGVEQFKNSVIVYSLGNFLFGEYDWTFLSPDNKPIVLHSALSNIKREGMGVTADFCKKETIQCSFFYSLISNTETVIPDLNQTREYQFTKLSRRLRISFYSAWWHLYSLHAEWRLRIGKELFSRLKFSNLKKIRIRHLTELFVLVKKSILINFQKTTNPYDS